MRVPYDKLRRYVETSPGYAMRESGNSVELHFATPSIAEAAGIGEGGEGRQIVIKGTRRGEYVEFTEAYIKAGDREEPMDLRDLELWIQYIENF
ncbi:MAG: hypothetical protein JHC22_03420 [Thermoproteus sp.]|nr:hypothetical protein [Thermoproteus sp.]